MPLSTISSTSTSSFSSAFSYKSSFSSYSTSYNTSYTSFSSPSPNSPLPPTSTLFSGCVFYFAKDTFKALKDKQKATNIVKDNGGLVSLLLCKKTTHFIVDSPTFDELKTITPTSPLPHSLVFQLNIAIKQNTPIVSLDFIYESATQQTLLLQYLVYITSEMKVIAHEIPLSVDKIAQDSAPIEAEPIEVEVAPPPDATPQPLPVPILPLEPSPMTTSFYPTFTYCIPFTPVEFMENDTPCLIMSLEEPYSLPGDEGVGEGLTFSFEESRFYTHSRASAKNAVRYLSFPDRPKPGGLWSWGYGYNGELGTGKRVSSSEPVFIQGSIINVSCGRVHTASVTDDGAVWTWGNGKGGMLGHGSEKTEDLPCVIPRSVFRGAKVRMVSCGSMHTAALTENGTLWAWGCNNQGQLGFPQRRARNTIPRQNRKIPFPIFVSCGGTNTAVLDRTGRIWTMGSNFFGQRGAGRKGLGPVTRVPFPGEHIRFKFISVGRGVMGALDMDGGLYMWGRNLENQCGDGGATHLYRPKKIEVGTEVIQVACGRTHCACVTANGDVFTWGWGPLGQLGHTEDLTTCTRPTHVESVSDISTVMCGESHTVALSPSKGKIWMWGSNERCQSGIPSYDSYDNDDEDDADERRKESSTWLSPQIIDSLSRGALISCGRDFTCVMIEGSYVPVQFTKDGNDEHLSTWVESQPGWASMDETQRKAAVECIRDDEFGPNYSLLHLAARHARKSTIQLLQNWISLEISDKNGNTPLHICAEHDISDCVRPLLSRASRPDLKNNVGKTAYHISVENRTMDVLQEFVVHSASNKSVIDDSGNTPLHTAIKLRHFEMAKYLIESAAQPQILDKSGKTALDYCSFKEGSFFKSLAQKNDVFISYAHVDLAFATKMKEFLELHSIKCWMDMTRLEAGNDWRLDIGTGLLSSKLVLFIGSRASVISDWCIKELHMAKKNGQVIIPIWHQKVEVDTEVRSLIFGRGILDFSNPNFFYSKGNKLSRKLKYVLSIVKQTTLENPYLKVPDLSIHQLWEQLFLTILVEARNNEAGFALETFLHRSAIFSCLHTLKSSTNIQVASKKADDLEHTWGLVLLVQNLKASKDLLEKWWKFAEANKKRVYLCMIRGGAADVNYDDLPAQALACTSVPLFYLESETSLQQLVYFIHLAQREEFMAKQVDSVQEKVDLVNKSIEKNEDELRELQQVYDTEYIVN